MTSGDAGFQRMISELKKKEEKRRKEKEQEQKSGVGSRSEAVTKNESVAAASDIVSTIATVASASAGTDATTQKYDGIIIDCWMILSHKAEEIHGPFFYNMQTQVGQVHTHVCHGACRVA